MRYLSTRGGGSPKTFTAAVLEGLAEDGGLLVPEDLPNLGKHLRSWVGLEYPALAQKVLGHFTDDLCETTLRDCCQTAYGQRYGGPVAPLVRWDDRYVLELFHGPTLAFKDVALQLLGQFFEVILAQKGEHLNIVAATSGDTGSAAIHGVTGCPTVTIFVTHPKGKIAELQRLQMTTVTDPSVFNVAVDGTFDDCQGMVKNLAEDLEFKRRYNIGAVNSINWARIAAQIVYYFAAYLQTPGAASGRPAVFAVPTGNFGNILAAEYARRMGLPIEELILASNENDILPKFFQTGVYRRGDARSTHSPAMDIQVASNFERFLYLLASGESSIVKSQMADFAQTGELSLLPTTSYEGWSAYSCSNSDTLATAVAVQESTSRCLDPHTATAWWALDQRLNALDPALDKIVVATAHPAKFPEVLQKVLPEGCRGLTHHSLEALRGRTERLFELQADTEALKKFVSARASLGRGVFPGIEEKAG